MMMILDFCLVLFKGRKVHQKAFPSAIKEEIWYMEKVCDWCMKGRENPPKFPLEVSIPKEDPHPIDVHNSEQNSA